MNDDKALKTAAYLSRKAREGVIVAAYAEDTKTARRLTVHIYEAPDEKEFKQLISLTKSKNAAVCYRGESLSVDEIQQLQGGAA